MTVNELFASIRVEDAGLLAQCTNIILARKRVATTGQVWLTADDIVNIFRMADIAAGVAYVGPAPEQAQGAASFIESEFAKLPRPAPDGDRRMRLPHQQPLPKE